MTAPLSVRSFRRTTIGGVNVLVPEPDPPPRRRFVGHERLVNDCLAAWSSFEGGFPLHFRLVGPPGVGKNVLVSHVARELGLHLYSMVGHEDFLPEDLICTGRLVGTAVEYVASPLVAAMLDEKGAFFLDEIGKLPPRSLSVLSSVLDDRRTITSTLAGFTLTAQPGFAFCAALNTEDLASLPRYIDDRLRPVFKVGYPPVEDLMTIVRENVPGAPASLLGGFRDWVARQKELSPRQAVALVGYACRLDRSMRCSTAKEAAAVIQSAAQAIGQES